MDDFAQKAINYCEKKVKDRPDRFYHDLEA